MASLENFRVVVFRAVAEHLNFRRAAEELYLTQPAVSLQVKALEEELGVQLFDRTGAKVALTAAGKHLLAFSRRAGALAAEAEEEVTALGGELAGTLALGASTTIAQYVLPRLWAEFRRRHTRAQMTMTSGNTEHIVEAVVRQEIALGLIEGPAHSRDVKTEPFLDDELVLIVPGAHEWAERAAVRAEEIAAEPLLMREHGSGTRQVIEQALQRCGIKRRALRVAMELDSTEAIKTAVEAGLGVGFVSRWALKGDQRPGRGLRVVEIEALRVRRKFLIATAAAAPIHGLAEEFRGALCGAYGALLSRGSAAIENGARLS